MVACLPASQCAWSNRAARPRSLPWHFDDVGFAGTDLDQLAGHTDADRTRPTRGRGDAHLPIGEP